MKLAGKGSNFAGQRKWSETLADVMFEKPRSQLKKKECGFRIDESFDFHVP